MAYTLTRIHANVVTRLMHIHDGSGRAAGYGSGDGYGAGGRVALTNGVPDGRGYDDNSYFATGFGDGVATGAGGDPEYTNRG
jgi:hypothetical protein